MRMLAKLLHSSTHVLFKCGFNNLVIVCDLVALGKKLLLAVHGRQFPSRYRDSPAKVSMATIEPELGTHDVNGVVRAEFLR